MTENLENFLGPELAALYGDGEKLLVTTSDSVYSDYSFVIFPFAKVYEGFLKKLFFQIGAISENQYNSDHWRVGKALNPQLEKELRHEESVYDRILNLPGGIILADALWKAWKEGRNMVFHYFPGQHQPLSFEKAREIVNQLEEAMSMALASLNKDLTTPKIYI